MSVEKERIIRNNKLRINLRFKKKERGRKNENRKEREFKRENKKVKRREERSKEGKGDEGCHDENRRID